MLLAAVQRSGARRWEVGVSCLLHTRAPSVRTGALNEGKACTRSEPRPLGAKCSVTLVLERLTMGDPLS